MAEHGPSRGHETPGNKHNKWMEKMKPLLMLGIAGLGLYAFAPALLSHLVIPKYMLGNLMVGAAGGGVAAAAIIAAQGNSVEKKGGPH